MNWRASRRNFNEKPWNKLHERAFKSQIGGGFDLTLGAGLFFVFIHFVILCHKKRKYFGKQ